MSSQSPLAASLRQARETLASGGPLPIAALVAGAAMVAGLGYAAYLVGIAALAPAPRPDAQEATAQREGEFLAAFDGYVSQIDGRSLFLRPAAPGEALQPEVVEAPPEEPAEPPKPATYGGPGVIAMIHGSVWFDNGEQLAVGESAGGVRVVSMEPPWQARLEWRGVEFDVPFFERDRVVAVGSSRGSSSAAPLPATPPEPTAPAADPAATPDAKPDSTPDAKPDAMPDATPGAEPSPTPGGEPSPGPAPEPASPEPASPEPASPEPASPEPTSPEPASPEPTSDPSGPPPEPT